MSFRVEELRGARRVWNDFVKQNRGGVFQSYEWGEFRTEMGWRVTLLGVFDGDELRLVGQVMRRSIPGGYGFLYCPEGPIVKDGDWFDAKNQQAFTVFNEHLKGWVKRDKLLFSKIDPHVPAEKFPMDWLAEQGYRDSPEDVQSGVVTEVDLTPDTEQIFKNMKQKGRYNIRQGAKKGVKVKMSRSAEALDIFYGLHDETAARQGITRRDKWYFAVLHKHLVQKADYGRFFIGYHDNEPISALLVTFFGNDATYQYGGSTKADRNLYASYLAQWSAMEEAKKRGCTFYNMTGVAATDDPGETWAGLRQFKLKFGGPVIHLVGARDYPYNKAMYHLFTQTDRVRRRLAKLGSGR